MHAIAASGETANPRISTDYHDEVSQSADQLIKQVLQVVVREDGLLGLLGLPKALDISQVGREVAHKPRRLWRQAGASLAAAAPGESREGDPGDARGVHLYGEDLLEGIPAVALSPEGRVPERLLDLSADGAPVDHSLPVLEDRVVGHGVYAERR